MLDSHVAGTGHGCAVAVVAMLFFGAGCGSESAGESKPEGNGVSPNVYDCSATSVPARRTPAPSSCGTDPGCGQRLMSAHRGAGAPGVLAPEDTLSAFRAAIAYGADFTECDVRLSADDVLVVIHDDSVDRTTTGSGNVADLSAAEIQAFGVRAESYPGDFSCERVPTFSEVLELVVGRVQLIVDGSKIDQVEPIVTAVRDANALDWVLYDNTDFSQVQAALALEPRLGFALRAATPTELGERLAVLPHAPAYVHTENAKPSSMVSAVEESSQRIFALGFGTDLAASLDQDPGLYGTIYDSGADIVMTNRPDLLGQYLNR